MNRPRKKDGYLPQCVYLKHGAYWHVKGNKWTKLGTDLHGALARYAELFEVRHGGIVEMIDKAMPHILARIKPGTAKQYRAGARRLKKALIEFKPEQVRPKHVFALKRSLEKTPHMANSIMTVGKLLFAFWLEEEVVESNPFAAVPKFKVKPRGRLPSRDEYDAIYAKADDELQIIMELWRGTGQRVMDVLLIPRVDADLDGPGIRVKQQKTDKKRIIKWTPELRAAVQRAKALYGKVAGFTLLHKRGRPLRYNTIRNRFKAACKAAGVEDLQQRDFRAMAATEAEKQGLDPTALLGHSERRTTQIYLRDKAERIVEGPSFRQSITVLDKATKKG